MFCMFIWNSNDTYESKIFRVNIDAIKLKYNNIPATYLYFINRVSLIYLRTFIISNFGRFEKMNGII